jgi:hypothetical protein
MKSVRTVTIFIFLLAIFNIVNGQPRIQPKRIKAKENYTHSSTHFIFPKYLLGDFQRESVYSFDRKNQNVGVSYGKNQNGERIMFSLYLYPAGDGYEGRLRQEYQKSMQSVVATTKKGLHATQHAIQHKGEKYICNGFEAIFTTENNDLSQLSIFESGTWFYKIRITSTRKDTVLLSDLKTKILQTFDPTVLTDLAPLNEKVSVYFAKTAFRDSILLGSAMGSAYGKIDWIMENVDEKERATGLPDLYLNFHVEGLKAFMEFQHRFDFGKSDFTKNYLMELQLISDADFLNEFVMEQFGMILIIPEDTPAKYDEYLKWKSQNNISINLNEKFYVLSFGARK